MEEVKAPAASGEHEVSVEAAEVQETEQSLHGGSGYADTAVVDAPPETTSGGGGGEPPPEGADGGGDDDDDEHEMARMSFLEHLEELRNRIVYALISVAASFAVCFAFAQEIFQYVKRPIDVALRDLKLPTELIFTKPTDAFMTYVNLSLIVGLFLASPFVLYQVWAFIAPGLYKKERKYAAPFIFFCSGLFIAGGLFGYLIAFPFALRFLLAYGGEGVRPLITITEYVDMFWTVTIGLGLIFELPVLMLFLGLLGIITPGFLLRNIRYAVLLIFVAAAVITPTADITNLMIFAGPMIALYMVGIGLVWIVQRGRGEA